MKFHACQLCMQPTCVSNYNVFKLLPYMGVDSVEMKNSICPQVVGGLSVYVMYPPSAVLRMVKPHKTTFQSIWKPLYTVIISPKKCPNTDHNNYLVVCVTQLSRKPVNLDAHTHTNIPLCNIIITPQASSLLHFMLGLYAGSHYSSHNLFGRHICVNSHTYKPVKPVL